MPANTSALARAYITGHYRRDEAMTCKNCGAEIKRLTLDTWIHLATKDKSCGHYAEPPKVTLRNPVTPP